MRTDDQWIWTRRMALALIALCLSLPTLATANELADEEAAGGSAKATWQAEYRRLLGDAALLKRNAEAARDNYSQSRQRGYPRGVARQQFLIDEENARKELAQVEDELEKFRLEARRDGVLPGWFREVEEGPIEPSRPAAPAEEDARDREGRNPLYLDDE